MSNKPFVSFIVMSYKAEKFIQEAIDGALSQTYDNMEIIFSDDASPDKTFEIVEKSIKNYTGKHKPNIRVIRNQKNMGIAAHLNKLWWQEAKGDWIVVSAGDDVSMPNRVERVMEFANDTVGIIHHYSYLIDENSNIIPHTDTYHLNQSILDTGSIEEVISKNICVRGGTMSLNKMMLDFFGEFNDDIINEDVILAYRAKYFGKIIHLDEKLMKYREHSNSISFNLKMSSYANYVKMKSRDSRNAIKIYNQILADNKILNLSESFLKELSNLHQLNLIDNFLYGSENFSSNFLLKKVFYSKLLKRFFLKTFLFLRKK